MRSSIVVLVAVVAGCMMGPTHRNFAPATGARGIGADLRVTWGPKGRLQGELLEVQDSALMILSADRLVLVPITEIRVGRFTRRGTLIAEGQAHRRTLDELKRLSRFPAGLSPEVKARLLAAYGQTAPDGPPPP